MAGRNWHSARDAPADCAGWLSVAAGSLGKTGQDICLMAQQGIDEIGLATGAAWTLEWMLLPQNFAATGTALRTALQVVADIPRIGSPER